MEPIEQYIFRMAAATGNSVEIWLIGSRANGSSRPDSDWDLLVFGPEDTFARLHAAVDLHRDDVDCMVVLEGGDLQSAWGRRIKSGALYRWHWDRTGDREATFVESKWREEGGREVLSSRTRRALLLWPPEGSAASVGQLK